MVMVTYFFIRDTSSDVHVSRHDLVMYNNVKSNPPTQEKRFPSDFMIFSRSFQKWNF